MHKRCQLQSMLVRIWICACALAIASATALAQADPAPAPPAKPSEAKPAAKHYTKLRVKVKLEILEPVAGALVYVVHGDDDDGLEHNTDETGSATFSKVAKGKVVIQVTAKDLATFGDDFNLTADEQTIDIVLKKPAAAPKQQAGRD